MHTRPDARQVDATPATPGHVTRRAIRPLACSAQLDIHLTAESSVKPPLMVDGQYYHRFGAVRDHRTAGCERRCEMTARGRATHHTVHVRDVTIKCHDVRRGLPPVEVGTVPNPVVPRRPHRPQRSHDSNSATGASRRRTAFGACQVWGTQHGRRVHSVIVRYRGDTYSP